jgi:hypothetical protein
VDRSVRIRERPGHGFARDGWGQASAVALPPTLKLPPPLFELWRTGRRTGRAHPASRDNLLDSAPSCAGRTGDRRNARSGGGKDEAGQGFGGSGLEGIIPGAQEGRAPLVIGVKGPLPRFSLVPKMRYSVATSSKRTSGPRGFTSTSRTLRDQLKWRGLHDQSLWGAQRMRVIPRPGFAPTIRVDTGI